MRFALSLLFAVLAAGAGAIRSQSDRMRWLSMFLDVTDDPTVTAEVSAGMTEHGRDFDVCQLHFVHCRNAVPHAVRFKRISGKLSLDRVVSPIEEITVEDAELSHTLDLSLMSPTLIAAHFRRVKSRAVTESSRVVLGSTRRRLRHLTVASCGVTGFDLGSVASLETLDLSGNPLGDTVELSNLPRALTALNLSGCGMNGAAAERIPTLPPQIRVLDVSNNALTGPMPCTYAGDLRELRLSRNLLTGPLCATLPATLSHFDAAFNRLDGSVGDMKEWWSLTHLNLHSNRLTAVNSWSDFPPDLEELFLGENLLAGSIRTASLPPKLRVMSVQKNNLSGEVALESLPATIEHIDVSHNRLSGVPNVRDLPAGVREVFLQHNNFSGTLALTEMPVGLSRIVFHHNAWATELPSEFHDL